ncbi:unnamed protein product [Prorocentrum cordatum]|uniref:Glucose-6-phosphate 1-epimerase n=1 Tax=Prorocentrum cordatum TaxID=2364126 RepID=A0ABN9UFB2_9DINO|nr:unnamed protein product [Polarella glacialis]
MPNIPMSTLNMMMDKCGLIRIFARCRRTNPPAISAATSDVVKIGAFTEEIYSNVLPGICRLTDPAKGSLDIINGSGWKDVVIWNPYGETGMGYEGFVCCESAGLTPVVCEPKGTWDATMRLVASPK